MSESLLTPKNVPFDMVHDREHRTDLHCHDCNNQFVALLDYRIEGNHVIECPHCGHEHCRVITGGAITGERWDSRFGNDKTRDAIRPRRMWKDGVLQARTTSAAEFIRAKWLDLPAE